MEVPEDELPSASPTAPFALPNNLRLLRRPPCIWMPLELHPSASISVSDEHTEVSDLVQLCVLLCT